MLLALEAIDPAGTVETHDEDEGSLDSMAGGVFFGMSAFEFCIAVLR